MLPNARHMIINLVEWSSYDMEIQVQEILKTKSRLIQYTWNTMSGKSYNDFWVTWNEIISWTRWIIEVGLIDKIIDKDQVTIPNNEKDHIDVHKRYHPITGLVEERIRTLFNKYRSEFEKEIEFSTKQQSELMSEIAQ